MSEVKVTLKENFWIKIGSDKGFIENQSVNNVLLYLILKQLEKFNEHNQRS